MKRCHLKCFCANSFNTGHFQWKPIDQSAPRGPDRRGSSPIDRPPWNRLKPPINVKTRPRESNRQTGFPIGWEEIELFVRPLGWHPIKRLKPHDQHSPRHPLKGHSFALMFWQHSGLNLIENISPSLFIQFSSQFVPNLHTALRIHSRYRLRLLSFTTIFSWPNFAPFSRPNLHDFPGRILHHFPGQIFATFFGRILQHSPIEFVESLATSELA